MYSSWVLHWKASLEVMGSLMSIGAWDERVWTASRDFSEREKTLSEMVVNRNITNEKFLGLMNISLIS